MTLASRLATRDSRTSRECLMTCLCATYSATVSAEWGGAAPLSLSSAAARAASRMAS